MAEDIQQLAVLRGQIDALDTQVLSLINQRALLAQAIGQLKQGAVYRAEREAQVLRRIGDLNQGPLPRETVVQLFREIMSACLALERPLSVAYLGPQGTFTQSASIRQFGHAATQQPCVSIDEVFREVEVGNADYGVVPVENSTEGAVNRTLDLLQTTPLHLCGEIELRIHQSLLRKVDGMLNAAVVYSHAQSLAQCHDWLSLHLPGVVQVAVASNAEAARRAAEDDSALAIAGEQAAETYGLVRLHDRIEDEPDNTTRFVVIARNDVSQASGSDKTSLLMAAPNKPGAIVSLLEPFREHGVSLTKLESRPARHSLLSTLGAASPWEYVFFVDIEGHREDIPVKLALQAITTEANYVKILGSYPKRVV
ncbi:MAG: prephenate dehydratase [Betaproteobacteria bacterium]|nr:prephenate dehydratase [Betaproteobacteria bacterium]